MHAKYQRLLEFCKTLPPAATAVAHPCDEPSLRAAVEAARLSPIAPVLVGPKARIEGLARQFDIDIAGLPIGILDGPLALDNAISLESVKIKPDLEAGNMLAKSLSFLAGADAAGIVLGARVPIILTSRADSVMTRLASCGIAALVANARREAATKAVM